MEKKLGKVITIDGPAGGGKSTAARILADQLGFEYLDTGAMYRSVALLGIRANIDWGDPDALVRLARQHKIKYDQGRIFLDGEDVSEAIRSSEVTAKTRYSADNPEIRALLVRLQQKFAEGHHLVTEGRDQGTVVFPNAWRKFYLTAGAHERARRRMLDLEARGEQPDFDALLRQIEERDQRDASRAVGPLRCPEDAQTINSDGKSISEVVAEMFSAAGGRGEEGN